MSGQNLVVVAVVFAATAWLVWRTLPRRWRGKGKKNCGPNCSCGD